MSTGKFMGMAFLGVVAGMTALVHDMIWIKRGQSKHARGYSSMSKTMGL